MLRRSSRATYESEDTESTKSGVGLGDRNGLLKLLESGVPGELRVAKRAFVSEKKARDVSVRFSAKRELSLLLSSMRNECLPPCRSVKDEKYSINGIVRWRR